jgi:hypothetical protein
MDKTFKINGRDNLWNWFGLSYASWITIPRVLAHAMPDEWQEKMAQLLKEYDHYWDMEKIEIDGTRVQCTKDGKLCKSPDWLLNYRHPDNKKIDGIKS